MGYPNIISKTFKCHRCPREESFHNDMQFVTYDVVDPLTSNYLLDSIARANGWELIYARDAKAGDDYLEAWCNDCYNTK
jgi:hypothetical protein